MNSEQEQAALAFLTEEFERFARVLGNYQWPWEVARWHELVFCVLADVDRSPAGILIARETTEILIRLDLLEVSRLASATDGDGEPSLASPDLSMLVQILARQGYSAADDLVVTLCQAAQGLQKEYDGKVQKYLRAYGKQMLDDVPKRFKFTRITPDRARYIFTNWLQNVTDMPVALANPAVQQVCAQLGIETDELIGLCDRNDVNVGLLDDWAMDHQRRSEDSDV